MRKISILSSLFIIFMLTQNVVFARDFDLRKFSEPSKYGWESPEDFKAARSNLLERQKLLDRYENNKQTIRKNLIKSAIVPGWGHFSCQKYTKGTIILSLELVVMGIGIYYYDRAMTYYDKYKKADYIVEINQYYNDAKTPYLYSQGFFVLGMLVWLYSMYDTVNVTDQYNQELWEKIFFNYKKDGLQVGINGITVRF